MNFFVSMFFLFIPNNFLYSSNDDFYIKQNNALIVNKKMRKMSLQNLQSIYNYKEIYLDPRKVIQEFKKQNKKYKKDSEDQLINQLRKLSNTTNDE